MAEHEKRPTVVYGEDATPEDRYEAEMNVLVSMARMILILDLDWMLATVERAHTTMPILDPTAYRDGMGNLRDQEKILRAAMGLRDAARAASLRTLKLRRTVTDDWKQKHANDAEKALKHEMVERVMHEFADNLKHNPDVAAAGWNSALFRYGIKKVGSYVAQVARAEALGIDPELLRATDEGISEHRRRLIEAAVGAGKPVIVVEAGESEEEAEGRE